jgi:hypothetical protein
MHALEGMDGLLEASPAVTIFSELWPDGLRRAGRSAEAYLARLGRHGFRVRVIDEAARRLVRLDGVQGLETYRALLERRGHALNVLFERP